MEVRTQIYWESENKYGEELCGDKVEAVQTPKETIMVLADGLGSGVKANILSTLTSKIAVTMLREGSSIEETVQTIMSTLPICKERKIAYSTFTIIRIDCYGRCYIAEYGNPPIFLLRDGKIVKIHGTVNQIAGKEVVEYRFNVEENDIFIVVSDGVIHAGIGGILNLGWRWDNVAQYIEKVSKVEQTIGSLVKLLSTATNNFYMDKPGDDATVAAIKVIRPRHVTVFTGPPQDDADDKKLVEHLINSSGAKVVCGGTAAQIVSRELGREIVTSTQFIDPKIPPIAYIEGIDLVTEGVLTLARTRDLIVKYINPRSEYSELRQLSRGDGASKLSRILVGATDITFLLGRAINPAHQNPDFPKDLSIKLNIVKEIIETLRNMGKIVRTVYF